MKCYVVVCGQKRTFTCTDCGAGMCNKHLASANAYIASRRNEPDTPAKRMAIIGFSKRHKVPLCQACRIKQAMQAEDAFVSQNATVDIFYDAVRQAKSNQPFTTPPQLTPHKLIAAWLKRAREANLKVVNYRVENLVSRGLQGSRSTDEYKSIQVRGWHFRITLPTQTKQLVVTEKGKTYLDTYECNEQELSSILTSIFTAMVGYLSRKTA